MPVRARFAVAVVFAAALLTGCGSGPDDPSGLVRTTTNIAGAGVVGLDRDTRMACPLPTPPDSASPDPQRIVVLDTQALDATCALGVWERVVGAATLAGPRAQPRYLGTGVKKIPGIGPVGSPDAEKIKALHPDLIVGAARPGINRAALEAVAPTVLVDATGDWQREFGATAAAMNRSEAGKQALIDYHDRARTTGQLMHAGQTQVSVLRFTDHAIRIEGADSFAGRILSDVGAHRPPDQRGDSKPLDTSDIDKAEGDLIYVIPAGDQGKDYAETIMKRDSWRDLGAATDKRVFAADDAIWSGNGLTAAKSMLEDLTKTLNGYVN